MKKILFAAVMMFSLQGAFATTLQDVSACKKDMVCMEQTAKQFLSEHPNSDKGHYILAQIEANRGDFRTASAELKKAESLASSMSPYPSFAGNADQYTKLKSKISMGLNQTQVAQTARTTTQTYQSPSYQTNASSNRIEVASPRDTAKSSGGSGGMGIFFGILGLIVVAAGAFWFISSNQKKKALQKQKTEQMAQLNDYIEKTNTALLIAKTDGLTNLQSEAEQTIQDLTAMMQQVRHGNLVSDYQMNMIANKVAIIKKTADSGKDWSAATVQAAQPVQPQYQQAAQPNSGGYSTPSYQQPAPVQQPQTVIVDRSSGGSDLLTGMMIGEMMHSHNNHSRSYDEPRHETVVVNNYNNYGSNTNNNDAIDFGGNDSDSDSNRNSGSFDFGGSDSSSSSNDSVDFGGSDSDNS